MDQFIHLATAFDADTIGQAVTYLAQDGRMGGTGNSGVSQIDKAVSTFIRVIGAVIGLGFFWNAAKSGWGKGDAKKQGMESGTAIVVGCAIIVVFQIIPHLIGMGEGLVNNFL